MKVALITAAILFGWMILSYVVRKMLCKYRGHRYDESVVLWRDCKRCGKHQTLKIGYGYVD